MGFACDRVWVMGYHMQIPAHQLGGPILLWVIRGYGLSEVWVKRSSTVHEKLAILVPLSPKLPCFDAVIPGVGGRVRGYCRNVIYSANYITGCSHTRDLNR